MVSLDNCIHCHKCRNNCAFLAKYGLDICDTEKLKELAYHCFLCGRCAEVCPVGIDGRAVILDLRRERVSSDEQSLIEKEYKSLISEKRDYRFRNWKHVVSGRVFFPGCNFPSMFPKTNAKLVKLFAQQGIGTVYECCGKPIAELGMKADEDRIIGQIREKLKSAGVDELITACPNCRNFFGDRLGIRVRSVYDILNEFNAGNKIKGNTEFYIPCPDRHDRLWIDEIRPFIDGEIRINDSAQCCGLGGSAIKHEKEIADGFARDISDSSDGQIFTYCASCVGRFRRSGVKTVYHILPAILGTDEQPDIYKSYINRMITKIR